MEFQSAIPRALMASTFSGLAVLGKGHGELCFPSCSLAGGSTLELGQLNKRTCVNQTGGRPSRCRRAHW
jgi:hypothetical protein